MQESEHPGFASLVLIVARYGFGTKNTVRVEVCCETCLQDVFPYWGSTDQIRPEYGLEKLAGLLNAKIRSTIGRIIRENFSSETVSCFYASTLQTLHKRDACTPSARGLLAIISSLPINFNQHFHSIYGACTVTCLLSWSTAAAQTYASYMLHPESKVSYTSPEISSAAHQATSLL